MTWRPWRPKNWNNPGFPDEYHRGKPLKGTYACGFEEGADTITEAIVADMIENLYKEFGIDSDYGVPQWLNKRYLGEVTE